MKFVDRKVLFPPTPVAYATDRSKAVVLVWVLVCVWHYTDRSKVVVSAVVCFTY